MADLEITIENHLATITLNRPDARNAMDQAILEQLPNELQQLADNDQVRCVVVTGKGDKAFCAGGDISGLGGDHPHTQEELVELLTSWAQSAVILHEMPKPTLAVVNGVAAGAGMALALACDLRIASTKASFVTAFSKLAMSGDFGGSYFLSKLVGPAKAKELYFLSDRIVAKEAEQLGMINRCVEPEVLAAEVSAVAERLVTIPLLTYKAMKSNLNAALTMDLRTVIKQEAEWMIKTAFSEDTRMAADTFFEK